KWYIPNWTGINLPTNTSLSGATDFHYVTEFLELSECQIKGTILVYSRSVRNCEKRKLKRSSDDKKIHIFAGL
ncbi:Protein of unknown function, partial [Gryllus bimaculatus]